MTDDYEFLSSNAQDFIEDPSDRIVSRRMS